MKKGTKKNAEMPKRRNAETPKRRNAEMPKRRNDEMPKRRNDEMPKRRNDETTKRRNAETPKRRNDETPKRRNAETPKCRNAETTKRRNAETPKRRNDETPKCRNAEMPKRRNDETPKCGNQSRDRKGAVNGAPVSEVMMQTAKSRNQSIPARRDKGAGNGAASGTALKQCRAFQAAAEPLLKSSGTQRIVGGYREAVETVAGYMGRAATMLEHLYADQDAMIEQLKRLLSKSKSLRRSDFDAIFANLLARRLRTRGTLSTLVAGYRAHREALLQGIEDLCAADAGQDSEVWPALKERLLDGQDPDEREVVAVLRQVHQEQEELSTALSGLLARGERLRISDLNTVVQRLASRDSRESAELAALLAACEAAGRSASMQWTMLAG